MANEGKILIQATVVAVKDDQILYPSCKQCYSKLQREQYEKEWVCFKCSTVYKESKLEWRYRLSITVAEKSSLTDITLFGKTLEPYFGTSAERFNRFLEKLDEDNLLEENMLLNALEETFVGQSFIFGIKSNARLKELQKYHGSMSPICASTVLKVRLGDYATQSAFNSDLVAVQILSSANVSFTGNTVLHNLQAFTDLNWESKPLCSVASTKSIKECSYLPYTTFDQSESYSFLKNCTNLGVELSYEKSVEFSNQTTFNESNLKDDVNVSTKSNHEEYYEQRFQATDKSGNVDDLVVGKLKLSLEQKKIKGKNNQVFRPKLTNKLCLESDPCLNTIDEKGFDRDVKNCEQQKKYFHTPELKNKNPSPLRQSNSAQDTSQVFDNCLKSSYSGNFTRTAKCDRPYQNITGSKLMDSFHRHATTKKSEIKVILRSESKLSSVPSIHDESSLEVLRNYDQEIKAHYDPSYLSFSDWDNSFNFTDLNSKIESKSQNLMPVARQGTMIDMPESENLDQFLTDSSLLTIDFPESLQLENSLKSPSDFKPYNVNKRPSKLPDDTSLNPPFKKSVLSPKHLNGVNASQYTPYNEKHLETVCDMPESEDLSKFLDNDSFDAQIMTDDFEIQQNIFPILDPKCDDSRIVLPGLDNSQCEILNRKDTTIDPHCDNLNGHNTVLKLTKCDFSENEQTKIISFKSDGADRVVCNNVHQSNAGSSDLSQNVTCDQSTYLSFEACLEEIENCELTDHSFVSSQIILDNESKKVQKPINEISAVITNFSLENSNTLSNKHMSTVCDKGKGELEHSGLNGDDSQGSVCLFSDEEDDQPSFIPNPQNITPCKDTYNEKIMNVPSASIEKDDFSSSGRVKDNSYNNTSHTHGVIKVDDGNINSLASYFEDSAADVSTVLDLEVMRNTSVHFNPDILTESLFADSISCSKNDISELLLAMDLKDVEAEKHSYQNVIQNEDSTADWGWGTEIENEDFLALDLPKATTSNRNQTCDVVVGVPPPKSEFSPRMAKHQQDSETVLHTHDIQTKQLPVITKAILDLNFDSVDDSEILAMDCSQKHLSDAPISLSKINLLEMITDEEETRKDLQRKEETVNDSSFSPSIATGKGGVKFKESKIKSDTCSDISETSNSPKPNIMPMDLMGNGVHENTLQRDRLRRDNDLNGSGQFLDVTEDGSIDLFECSQSFLASQHDVRSQVQSILAVDNSVFETSETFTDPTQNVFLNKKVKFARRLSTVRHLNLVDIRINMCKTSSPLASALHLKSCLRKSVQATSELDESVFSQNVFSPSPVKPARDLCPTYVYRTEGPKQLRQEPGINCYNSTPVNSNPLQGSSIFSPDLFSPG